MTQQNLIELLLAGVCCLVILAIIYSIRFVKRWCYLLMQRRFSHKSLNLNNDRKKRKMIPPKKLKK